MHTWNMFYLMIKLSKIFYTKKHENGAKIALTPELLGFSAPTPKPLDSMRNNFLGVQTSKVSKFDFFKFSSNDRFNQINIATILD